MKMNKLALFLGTCCLAIAHMSLSASAQKPVVKSTHGDWHIQCEGSRGKTVNAADIIKDIEDSKKTAGKSDKSGKPGANEQCGMVQTVKSKERKNVGLSIIIFRTKHKGKPEGALLRVLAPSGVFLPNGFPDGMHHFVVIIKLSRHQIYGDILPLFYNGSYSFFIMVLIHNPGHKVYSDYPLVEKRGL